MKIYLDRTCKKPVPADIIVWDHDLIIKLVTGKEMKFSNTAKAGQTATATIYLRNEGKYPCALTSIKHPDKRLSISIEQGFLERNAVTKLTITFVVPDKVTPKDVIPRSTILIEGYYVYSGSE